MELTTHEQAWLDAQRRLRQQVFVGVDHHSAQLTVTAATGATLLGRPAPRELSVRRFAQDGYGYRELLAWLAEQFPGVERSEIWFASEPTYARPLGHFLRQQGFTAEQVAWVKPEKVPQYRKANDLSAVGKNDDVDAQVLTLLRFETHVDAASRVRLFAAPPAAPVADDLRQLAEEYQRLTVQSVQLQGKIHQLVLLVFPEVRRVFVKKQTRTKPGGLVYDELMLDLFDKSTPLAVLGHFPSPGAVAAAGFDGIWAVVGKKGVRRAVIRQLVEVAKMSAGVPDALASRRLRLLIAEYQERQQRLETYRQAMRELIDADPVLASLLTIPCVSEVVLATLVGEIGDLGRFETADQVKRHLGLAPKPMPQTGQVDEMGKVVQAWRMPSNTYKLVNGRKQLVTRTPGKHAPRQVTWLWFAALLKTKRWGPDDPFVRLYERYKARLQGRPRWLGKARWKVVGKLIRVLFACLKQGRSYAPDRMRDAG